MNELDLPEFETALGNLVEGLSIASLIGIIWTVFIFITNPKRIRYLPHRQTLILIAMQGLSSIGGILYTFVCKCKIDQSDWYKYLFYFIQMVGDYGTCTNTALVGVSLYLITSYHSKWVLKVNMYLNILGVIIPFLIFFI